jgi:hypothetical protein
MNAREKLSWCLAGLLALTTVGGWGCYHRECRGRAAERQRWRANLRLLGWHALRGMTLEAQKAKEQGLQQEKAPSH